MDKVERDRVFDAAEVLDVVIAEAATERQSGLDRKRKTEICILWKSTPAVHALIPPHLVQENGYALLVLTQLGIAFPFGDLAALSDGLSPNFVRKIFAKLVDKMEMWTFDDSPEFRAVVEKHQAELAEILK